MEASGRHVVKCKKQNVSSRLHYILYRINVTALGQIGLLSLESLHLDDTTRAVCFLSFVTCQYVVTLGFHCIGTGWSSFPL